MSSENPLQASHLHTLLPSSTHPIILRSIRIEDAVSHAALLTEDPANPRPVEKSQEGIKAQLESMQVPTILHPETGRVLSGPKRCNMVICLAEGEGGGDGGEVIGLGGYGAIKDWERDGKHVRAGDVGVMLFPEYQGRGYAVEAMKLAINWAFTPVAEGGPQLDIVTITTDGDNRAMIRLTEEKLGLKNGKMIESEWDSKKQDKYWEFTPAEWRATRN